MLYWRERDSLSLFPGHVSPWTLSQPRLEFRDDCRMMQESQETLTCGGREGKEIAFRMVSVSLQNKDRGSLRFRDCESIIRGVPLGLVRMLCCGGIRKPLDM